LLWLLAARKKKLLLLQPQLLKLLQLLLQQPQQLKLLRLLLLLLRPLRLLLTLLLPLRLLRRPLLRLLHRLLSNQLGLKKKPTFGSAFFRLDFPACRIREDDVAWRSRQRYCIDFCATQQA
jgi:hypothetical protein